MRMILPIGLVLKSNSLNSIKSWLLQKSKFVQFSLIVTMVLFTITSKAQCPPGGTINFTSQAQIDAFSTTYPTCTILTGDMTIAESVLDDITDLSGLAQLIQVDGTVSISLNHGLVNLIGLQNITSIGDDLDILNNNNSLTSLSGLEGLTSIGGSLNIYNNDALPNIDPLSNLTSVGSNLSIWYNDILTNIDGLLQVTSMNGELKIQNNYDLLNILGIKNINIAGISNLIVINNSDLTICQVQTVCNYLDQPSIPNDVHDNAGTCLDSTAISNSCSLLASDCPADLILYTSDTTCFSLDSLFGPISDCTIDSFSYTINGVVSNGTSMIIDDTTTLVLDTLGAGTHTISYYIEDCYGSKTCDQVVTVQDTFGPIVSCPPALKIQCNPYNTQKHTTLNQFINAGGTVDDNCAINSSIIGYNMFHISTNKVICDQTFIRMYHIWDIYGNKTICDQEIIVSDTIKPTFDAPNDIVINCNDNKDDLNITGEILNAFDNCGIMDTSYTDVVVPGSCPSNFIVTRQWVLIDSCSNSDTLYQVISIEDNDAPLVTTQTIDIYLDASGNATIVPSDIDDASYDECGLDVILTIDKSAFTCDDLGTINVNLTVTDSCGNSLAQGQLVTVIDTFAPIAFITAPALTSCSVADVPLFTSIAQFQSANGVVNDNCGAIGIALIDEFASSSAICPQTIIRRYVINDISNNTDTVDHAIIINDTERPVITCPNDTTVFTDLSLCSATFNFGIATATDNCTILNIANDKVGTTFSEGTHEVEWIVNDGCGNADTCIQTITVIDNEDPIINIKNDLVINLTSNGTVTLGINTFVASYSDNCKIDSITIRRMNDNCSIAENLIDGEEVVFCCADVTTGPHNVIVTAWDIHGNSSQSMSSINIQDKLAPKIISCPSDVVINCEYPLDMNDLSVFGKLVTDPSLAEDIIVDGIIFGKDGVVEENCPDQIQITVTVSESIECGQGAVYRTFHVTDASGIEVTCTQNIFIVDVAPFTKDSITWPEDVIIETSEGFCNPTVFDPDDYGKPTYIIDDCNLIGQTYEDIISFYPEAGCKVVTRRWKVIDWCQYQANTSIKKGIWIQDQKIVITNSIAPIITSTCNDTILCASEITCNGNTFNLTIDATDDCTDASVLQYSYEIDLNNNGKVNLIGKSKNANYYYKNGTHKITWTVNDRCGNKTSCDYLFTVQDCKAPAAICLHGLSANLNNGGSVTLWASDFNKGSYDNCTATSDLKLSFSSDINEFGKTYYCSDIGEQEVELWVTDATGNQSVCVTYIVIQDNQNICPEQSPLISIAGQVVIEDDVMLEDVNIFLSGPEMKLEFITNNKGHFDFEKLPSNYNYKLEAKKDGDDMFGVSTLDILLIQRHILQLRTFESPYQLLAADVNNSGSINASDIIELRKLVLGKIPSFTSIDSWRFVNTAYDFDDLDEPWDCITDIHYTNVNSDMMSSNFRAVKLGDVNGTVAESLLGHIKDSRDAYYLNVENTKLQTGEHYKLPVYGSQMSIAGLQLFLKYESSELEIVSVSSGIVDINEGNVNIDNKGIDISWTSNEQVTITDEPLFYINLIAKQSIETKNIWRIENRGLKSEVYDETLNIYKINLGSTEQQDVFYQLYEATPNPFTGATTIRIDLPFSTELSIKVRDNHGKLVYTASKIGAIGENSFVLSDQDLNSISGMLYYTISTKDFVKTKKMIKL